MPIIEIEWTVSDQEYAALQVFVATQGQPDDTVDTYAARVALKGLRGLLETLSAEIRRKGLDVLVQAYDAADDQTKDAALTSMAELGLINYADGQVTPKTP